MRQTHVLLMDVTESVHARESKPMMIAAMHVRTCREHKRVIGVSNSYRSYPHDEGRLIRLE